MSLSVIKILVTYTRSCVNIYLPTSDTTKAEKVTIKRKTHKPYHKMLFYYVCFKYQHSFVKWANRLVLLLNINKGLPTVAVYVGVITDSAGHHAIKKEIVASNYCGKHIWLACSHCACYGLLKNLPTNNNCTD